MTSPTTAEGAPAAAYMGLAREVITEACRNYAAGIGPDDRFDFDSVLNRRWPGGPGGVGHAHARTKRHIRAAIEAYYAPDDHSREPDGSLS